MSSDKVSSANLPDGFEGGCENGVKLYVQNQFEPYGVLVRKDIDEATSDRSIDPNQQLTTIGWYAPGGEIYPDNPEMIRGEVWYYLEGRRVWVSDAGVRSERTEPAANNSADEFTPDQAAPRPASCELTRQ